MEWVESSYQGISFATKEGSKKPYVGRYFVKKTAKKSRTTRYRPVVASFETERQRIDWAGEVTEDRTKNGSNSISLDPSMRKKWETAQAIIGKETDPIEVALAWKARQDELSGRFSKGETVRNIVEKFLVAESTSNGAEEAHHNKRMFERLEDRYGNEHFKEFANSTADIEQWLKSLPFAERTKVNHYKQFKKIFTWAFRHRLVSENPFNRIKPPDGDELREIGFMPVDDVIRLFEANYNDPFTCALLAINIFGGMRTSAVGRIERHELDFEDRTIETPAWKTKKRRGKLLEKQPPTMWAWLERARDLEFAPPCRDKTNSAERKIWKKKVDRRIHALKERALVKAGLAASTCSNKKRKSTIAEVAFGPPNNWARHSFATYHCAAYRDYNETANLLSHSETIETLEEFYQGKATEAEGLRFFTITPDYIQQRLREQCHLDII